MKDIRQLTQKESFKLRHKVYKLELELKEKVGMLINKENSINAIINEMIDLRTDLKYEVNLNLKLTDELQTLNL